MNYGWKTIPALQRMKLPMNGARYRKCNTSYFRTRRGPDRAARHRCGRVSRRDRCTRSRPRPAQHSRPGLRTAGPRVAGPIPGRPDRQAPPRLSVAAATRPWIVPVTWADAGRPEPPRPSPPQSGGEVTDLAVLADEMRQAAGRMRIGVQPSPWLAPLRRSRRVRPVCGGPDGSASWLRVFGSGVRCRLEVYSGVLS
jgi:hypothetical protein